METNCINFNTPLYFYAGINAEHSFATRWQFCTTVTRYFSVSATEVTCVVFVGIGSGISYIFNKQHKFNILTLYSTFR